MSAVWSIAARPRRMTTSYTWPLMTLNTKTKAPQTNSICKRFHKTILQEFYQVALRRKIYRSIDELQVDLDDWIDYYSGQRTHQGKMCCGRPPMQTLIEAKEVCDEGTSTELI